MKVKLPGKIRNKIPLIKLSAVTACLLISATLSAQDKTYPVKTTAKPDELKTYEVSETDGSINLLFTKKGKKYEIYTNYVFDKDLNLVTETEEEMDVEKAKKNYSTFGRGLSFT